jgi:hypothetical protein
MVNILGQSFLRICVRVWQRFHGAVVLEDEPWKCIDPQLLLARGLLFSSMARLIKSSPDLRVRLGTEL